ncbi:hypothetical protein BDZ97DRAFT_1923423 [Flammula alnicola]|nr:hypothetical protein BDZ97DRAFT_1923423 [Flammula alnicola]
MEVSFELAGPSPISINPEKYGNPRAFTIPKIHEYMRAYAQAVKNAVKDIPPDVSNTREDEYGGGGGGGSMEKRSRLTLKVLDAVVTCGSCGTGQVRGSAHGVHLKVCRWKILYFSLRVLSAAFAPQAPVWPTFTLLSLMCRSPEESSDFSHALWFPKSLITCGGYTRETTIEGAGTKGGLVAFGKPFISNPDFPTQLEKNLTLGAPNLKMFYTLGEEGYTGSSFAEILE